MDLLEPVAGWDAERTGDVTAERETSEEGRAEEVGVPEGVRRSGAGGLREEAMVDIVWGSKQGMVRLEICEVGCWERRDEAGRFCQGDKTATSTAQPCKLELVH